MSPPLKLRANQIFIVTVILLLAATMRIWNIDKESFWADEGWSMILSKGPTLPDVVRTMADDQHPPLYFVLLHYWIDLTGNSEVTTRLLSAFWSLIGVALAYRLGVEVFPQKGRTAGMLAALMLALADNDIMLAQEARHYTQMAMLAILSTLFYFRYLWRPTRGNGIGWLLSSVALMYTHYLGAFILGIQLIHILIFGNGRCRDLLVRWGAMVLAWLPWAVVFIGQSMWRYTRPMIYRSSMPNSPETFALVRGDLFGAHFGLTFGLMLLGMAYVTYRPNLRWTWRPLRPTVYLALWFALPILVIVAVNTRYEILTPRNFLLIAPAIAVLIGHGLTNLDRTARTFLLAVLAFVGVTTVDSYFVKPPWRQVARDILDHRIDGESVLMDVWVDDFALRYHIGRDLHVDPATLPLVSIPEWREKYREIFEAALLQYLSDKESFWFAYWGDSQNPFLKFLTDHGFTRTAAQRETHLQTNEIVVYRYDRVLEGVIARFGDLFELKQRQIQKYSKGGQTELRVSLLWKALKQTPLDYSVSVFLLASDGRLITQHDAAPFAGRPPTSTWQPGDIRFDHHRLTLPATLSPGRYDIAVKVYWYGDAKPLPVASAPTSVPAEYVVIGSMELP
jgi:hypothetical protein